MRIARKLALLAASVCVVMAFAASSASALSVVHESNNVVCGTVAETVGVLPEIQTTGEVCPLKGTSTDLEFGGAFGIMIVCDVTLEGVISGTGKVEGNYTTSDCPGNETANSSATPCPNAGQRHAEAQLTTETMFRADFCTVAFGLTNTCNQVEGTITEVAHVYTLTFNHVNKCSNGVNSLQGSIVQVIDAAHPKIEIKD
jgi:hypothetical protein